MIDLADRLSVRAGFDDLRIEQLLRDPRGYVDPVIEVLLEYIPLKLPA